MVGRKSRSQANTFVRFLFSGCAAALPWPFGLLVVVLPIACHIVLPVVSLSLCPLLWVSVPPSNTIANVICCPQVPLLSIMPMLKSMFLERHRPSQCLSNGKPGRKSDPAGAFAIEECLCSAGRCLGFIHRGARAFHSVFRGQRCQGHPRTTCHDLLSDFPEPPGCEVTGLCFGAEKPRFTSKFDHPTRPTQAESSKSSARIWRDEALYFTRWLRQCHLAPLMSRVHL